MGLRQVLRLVRVGFEVVKLFVVEINIAGVLEASGAEGLGFGDCFVFEEVLVKEIGPPVRLFTSQKRQEACSLHLFRDGQVNEFENRGCDVDIEGEFVAGKAAEILRSSGIVKNQGNTNGFLVREPFSREAMLAEVKTVIAGEDYDSVVGEAETFELVADFSNDDVDAVNEAVIVFDGLLKFFGSGEAYVPPSAGFGCAEEFGQCFEIARVCGLRSRDGDIFIQVFVCAVGDELARVAILDVRGFEIYGEAEGFFFGAAIQEFGYLVGKDTGEVFIVPVFIFAFVR